MTSAITDFWVDPDWCSAHYLCIYLAPVFFEMRDGAWAVSVRPTDFLSLSAAEAATIFRAAAHCPVAAIKVRLHSGEVIDADSPILMNLAGSSSHS